MFDIPESARKALRQLIDGGHEAYLVGGCVRDMLMGMAPKDWDIVTSATPTETACIFQDRKMIETGLKHGTVTVLLDGEALEITTYRIDSTYSDYRRPDSVSFTRSIVEDLARRDFTINAIAYGYEEGLLDPHAGEADIKSGVIRCVGDPDLRFKEDGLRILRALRFASSLKFEIETRTSEALHRNKEILRNISVERINSELTKTLCGKNVGKVLKDYADIVCVPIPEIENMIGFEQYNEHHNFDVWQHTIAVVENSQATPVARWTALMHDIGKPYCFSRSEDGVGHFFGHAEVGKKIADRIMKRLKFDNTTLERVSLLISYHDTPIAISKKSVRKYLNRLGVDAFAQLIYQFRADNLGQAPGFRGRQNDYIRIEEIAKQIIEENACFSLKDMAVKGNDLILLGYRGEEIGQALDLLLDAVIEEKVVNEKESLLQYLQKSN